MYELSKDEAAKLNDAVEQALLRSIEAPYCVGCDLDVARRFLAREVLTLHKEGCAEAVLAPLALGRLREHLQKQQSAQRLAQNETAEDERAA